MKLTPKQEHDVAVFHEAARRIAKHNDYSCHEVARVAWGDYCPSYYHPLRMRYTEAFNNFHDVVFDRKGERVLALLFAAEMVKTGDL